MSERWEASPAQATRACRCGSVAHLVARGIGGEESLHAAQRGLVVAPPQGRFRGQHGQLGRYDQSAGIGAVRGAGAAGDEGLVADVVAAVPALLATLGAHKVGKASP